MSKTLVLSHPEHQLYELLKDLPDFYDFDDEDLMSDHLVGLSKNTVIFDFSVGSTDEKKTLFDFLEDEGAIIYSDLSSCWGEALFEAYPRLKGGFGCAFFSPQKTFEAFARSDKDFDFMENFFNPLELFLCRVKSAGLGFHFPRILAQIINEAAFSAEDRLASPEDIDKAMKFGVNYPLGPFTWLEKTGVAPVVHLLDELYSITGEPRYRSALSLRKKLLKP